MGGGLRVDPRELPPAMQEQVASKILAQISANYLVPGMVAGMEAKPATKAPVRVLQLKNRRNINRYKILKDAVREGVISDLKIESDIKGVWGFSFKIQWGGEFVPTGIPFKTLQSWASFTKQLGKGVKIVEPIIREARE